MEAVEYADFKEPLSIVLDHTSLGVGGGEKASSGAGSHFSYGVSES